MSSRKVLSRRLICSAALERLDKEERAHDVAN
jgi:hypothetical protein